MKRRIKAHSWVKYLLITFLLLWGSAFAGPDSHLIACKSNVKNIGTAVQQYAEKHGGNYPATLRAVRGGYLKQVPKCPSAGKDTYSATYRTLSTPEGYRVSCGGHHHATVGYPKNQPAYNGVVGLEKVQINPDYAAGSRLEFPESGPSRYSIRIPKGWMAKSGNYQGFSLQNPKDPEALMTFALSREPSDPNELIQKVTRDLEKSEIEAGNPRKFTIGSLSGLRTKIKGKGTSVLDIWSCADGKTAFNLSVSCSASNYRAFERDFETTLRSIRAAR